MPLALRLLPVLVAVELAVLAGWWHPALIPVGLLAAAAALWRRAGRGLPQWIAIRARWRSRRRSGWDRGGPAAVLGRIGVAGELDGAGRHVAVLEDGGACTAILAVDPPRLLSGDAPAALPWPVLAALLADPVQPSAVQVVTGGSGRTWLALRVDPERSGKAVARRGGGTEGCRKATIATASRAAAALGEAGLPSRLLNAVEARAVLAAVAHNPALAGAAEAWQGWQGTAGTARYWLARRPAPGWTSVTLTPSADSAGAPGSSGSPGSDAVSCRALYLGDKPAPDALPLDGQHGPALLAAAPLAWDAAGLGPAQRLDSAGLARLGPAAPGAALPLGYDAAGEAVHAALHRSRPTDIALVGGVQIGRLLVQRAAVRTVVVTARPEAWTKGGGLPATISVLAPATAFEYPGTPTSPGLVLWDRIAPPTRPAWCATVTLIEDLTPASAAPLRAADLILAHRLTEEQAKVFAAALGLSARQRHWLGLSPADGLAAVEGPELSFLALGAE